MTIKKLLGVMTITFVAGFSPWLAAQVETPAPPEVPGAHPVTVERIKVHGASLEGNLEGESADRDVIVYLPPSYAKQSHRRYPVVYALHGYFIGADQWSHEIHVPQTLEGAFALGASEMIVVLPDAYTSYNGSMYSSSVTTGDFENFIASFTGRLRRAADWNEACGRVWQPVRDESVLFVGPRSRAAECGQREGTRISQHSRRICQDKFYVACSAGRSGSVVARPDKPAAIPGFALQERRTATRCDQQVGG
jgi:hypothetical protein